jgi:hypothetical protein
VNIYCRNFRPDAFFIMRSDRKISDADNIRYEKIGQDAYILKMEKETGSLSLEEK